MGSIQKQLIFQCVREIGPGGGVSGVAWALDEALRRHGEHVCSFTITNLGLKRSANKKSRNLYRKKAVHLFDVLVYSTLGTIIARWKLRRNIVICHNDIVYGQIYVNHGLHRGMLDASGRKWRMLLQNPLHMFLWIREGLRFGLDVHDCYVCFSESEKALLNQYFPKTISKVRVIPNGVDLQQFRADAELRQSIRKDRGILDSTFMLVFVGHEYERKGLAAAIQALATLDVCVELTVIGGTNEEMNKGKAIAREFSVQDRVHFLGVLPTAAKILNSCDCLVLPSRFEAWPLVGLEAMACGLPVLITPVGGVRDFLQDGLNGFLIARDAESIAEKVRKLLSDPGLYQSMRMNSIRTAERYSWENIAKQYLLLVNQIRTRQLQNGSRDELSYRDF